MEKNQQLCKFQEYRVRSELRKLTFIEQVHLSLYDLVERAKPAGAFTFNELEKDSVEFRYYLDGVVDQSIKPKQTNEVVTGDK